MGVKGEGKTVYYVWLDLDWWFHSLVTGRIRAVAVFMNWLFERAASFFRVFLMGC
jgi:hypothetical protein